MRVSIGTLCIYDRPRPPRLFPRFRRPSGVIALILYTLVMVYIYALLAEVYALIALVLAVVWLGVQLWRLVQRQSAAVALKRARAATYEAELRQRADDQHADWLAGGSGLPDEPLTQPRPPEPSQGDNVEQPTGSHGGTPLIANVIRIGPVEIDPAGCDSDTLIGMWLPGRLHGSSRSSRSPG